MKKEPFAQIVEVKSTFVLFAEQNWNNKKKRTAMYPPLALAIQLNINAIPDDNKAKQYLLDMEAGNDQLLQLLDEHSGFGTERYDGPYKEFSDYIHRQWRNMYKWATGYEPERDVFNSPNRATVLDSLAGMVLCSKWSKYKRVYRFDPELELALATVDEVKIPLKMLDRLPFKSFYIEFAPDGIFTPAFHGSFVEVLDLHDAIALRFMRLTSDLRSMSGSGIFHIDKTQEEPYVIIKREHVDGHHDKDPNSLRTDWEEFCFFVLNAMIYLCASNAEVRETSYISNPNAPRKTKIAEESLKVSECGYVFGETVRLHRKEQQQLENKIIRSTTTRKSPRPHPVKASWQHYWTGTGDNKKRVLLFKDPYFTGGKVNVATISRVVEQ